MRYAVFAVMHTDLKNRKVVNFPSFSSTWGWGAAVLCTVCNATKWLFAAMFASAFTCAITEGVFPEQGSLAFF